MTTLERLRRIETDGTLRALLRTPLAAWESLLIDHDAPVVERLWTRLDDDHRIYLHRIHPCSTPLYHPHPWPSAVRILRGSYDMQVGYGDPFLFPYADSTLVAPAVACELELRAGDAYGMDDPWGWHSVAPIGGEVLSIMITGRPWPKLTARFDPPAGRSLPKLTVAEAERLYADIIACAFGN